MMPHADFFASHTYDVPLLLLLAFFPRIALLFVGGPFAWFQWAGWFICPHITVAIMATLIYWDTNPLLVGASWFFALFGSSSETKTATRTARRVRRSREVH